MVSSPADARPAPAVAGAGGVTLRSARSIRWAPFTTAGIVLGAWGIDLALDPTTHHVPLCPFHVVTGWWCPLCGGLRAAWEIGHGNVAAALHDNVLFVLALPLLFLYWLDWIARARRGQTRRRLSPLAFGAVVTIAVAFWVVRNLPGFEAVRPL